MTDCPTHAAGDIAGDPIRMVCFDAGGVLLRICRSWQEGCQAAGIDVRGEEVTRAKLSPLKNAFQRGELEPSDFFQQTAELLGGVYQTWEVEKIHSSWILGEYEGVDATLNRLNENPAVVTGLLSNTNAAHWDSVHMLGKNAHSVISCIEHPHASHLLGLIKPDEQIYRAFETQTGFAGREILFFDDLPENVEAARAAGWLAELIDHRCATSPQIDGVLQRYGLG